MTLRAFHLRTRCPRSALQGRLAGSICLMTASLHFHSGRKPSEYRVHNPRGIFAAADAIAAVNFGDAPLL